MEGVPVGFDWPALFEMARATGVAPAALAQFLPEVEASAITAMNKRPPE